ncbi:MAG: rhodanese-like domain-containing protein [Gammaproteobacteria bacterium]
MREITVLQLIQHLQGDDPLQVIDIRNRVDWEQDRIPGAILIEDAAGISGLDPELPTVVYCYLGYSSQPMTAQLESHGFTDVASMIGGFKSWREHQEKATNSAPD